MKKANNVFSNVAHSGEFEFDFQTEFDQCLTFWSLVAPKQT